MHLFLQLSPKAIKKTKIEIALQVIDDCFRYRGRRSGRDQQEKRQHSDTEDRREKGLERSLHCGIIPRTDSIISTITGTAITRIMTFAASSTREAMLPSPASRQSWAPNSAK